MNNSLPLFIRIFVTLICFIFVLPEASAQKADFFVSRIDTSKFPVITADFMATDAAGKSRTDVQSTNFIVSENGVRIDPSLVSTRCDEVILDPEVSVILVMDQSSSMDIRYNGIADRIEWMKYGGVTFVNNLKFVGRTSVAVTSFGTSSKLVANFTDDRQELIDSINKIKPGGTTNYNNPFLDPFTGVINLFKSRPQDVRKVVVFMTDGDPDPNINLRTSEIIDSLKHYNIQVYSIALYLPTNDFLANVAKLTGGKTFNAYTRQELANIYELLALENQFSQKCYLQWIAPYSCSEFDRIRNVDITFAPLAKTENKVYTVPLKGVANLQPSESILSFGNTPLNQDASLPVAITAHKADFLVNDVSVLPTGYFRIPPGGITVNGAPQTPPFVLPLGQTMEVQVIFTQKDRQLFRQAELFVNSSPCPQRVTLVGGLSQVRLISPNGDEPGDVPVPFKTCDTIDIQWSGVEKADPVNLYYSTTNGIPAWNWIPIASEVTGLSYKWKAPQAGRTYRIKVEVANKKSWQWSKQFGAAGDDVSEAIDVTSDNFFAFIAGHFENTVDISSSAASLPPLVSSGQKDMFLAKYDADGNVLWAAKAGGPKDDRALALTTDAVNNIYVAGLQAHGAAFGTKTLQYHSNDSSNFFIAKYKGTSDTPEWMIYGKGHGEVQRGFSKADSIVYSVENGTGYIYVNIDYKYYMEVMGISTTISVGDGTDKKRSFILQVPVDNPYLAKTVAKLPPGVKFPSDPKFDLDGNQNGYYTGKFNPTLQGSFNPKYNLPGIPDLNTRGQNDAFIAKIGGIPGSSDSSDHLFIVDSPAIQFTSVEGAHVAAEDIGSIAAGQTLPVYLKATIKNIGTMDLILDSAAFIGTHNAEFSLVSSLNGIVLKVDSSITIELNFTPADVGIRTADLVVFGSCDAIASITVTGTGLPPCLADPEEFVVFGMVGLNTTNTRSNIPCLLTFSGLSPVTVKPVLKGNDPGAFTLTIISPALNPDQTVTLNPGQCLVGTITFSPTQPKPYLAEIHYEGMCGDPVTKIGGEGLRPHLELDDKDWGKRRMLTSHAAVIYLQNKDSVDAIIDNISLADAASQDFKIESVIAPDNSVVTYPYILKQKQQLAINVRFTPTSSTGFLSTGVEVDVATFTDPLKGFLKGTGVLPIIEARDTTFKAALVGAPSNQIITYIYNRSKDTSLYIEKITPDRNDGGDFSFVNPLPQNTSIAASDSLPIAVNFTPSQAGMRVLKLNILSDAEPGPLEDPRVSTIVTITGDGLDIVQTPSEPFKNTLTCETPTQAITITNPSATQTLEITGFTPQGGNTQNFSVAPVILSIAPNSTGEITVTFMPDVVGNYTADFNIENSFGKDIHLVVTGDARTAPLELAADPVESGAPGDVISVPVKLTTGDYGMAQITSLSFILRTDAEMLRFKNVISATGWIFTPTEIAKGEILISGNGPALQSNLLKTAFLTLEFDVFLAKESSTPIEITDIKTGSNCIVPASVNSAFAFKDICFLDARRVNLGSVEYMLQEVHPNPVSGQATIFYGVGLDGRTVLTLHNSAGVTVATLIDQVLQTGTYETIVPLGDIPAGVYFYTIQSGPYTATRKLVITQ